MLVWNIDNLLISSLTLTTLRKDQNIASDNQMLESSWNDVSEEFNVSDLQGFVIWLDKSSLAKHFLLYTWVKISH